MSDVPPDTSAEAVKSRAIIKDLKEVKRVLSNFNYTEPRTLYEMGLPENNTYVDAVIRTCVELKWLRHKCYLAHRHGVSVYTLTLEGSEALRFLRSSLGE